jgi:hypothetical protein
MAAHIRNDALFIVHAEIRLEQNAQQKPHVIKLPGLAPFVHQGFALGLELFLAIFEHRIEQTQLVAEVILDRTCKFLVRRFADHAHGHAIDPALTKQRLALKDQAFARAGGQRLALSRTGCGGCHASGPSPAP